MTILRHEAVRFSRYGLIGLINNAALYLLFVALVYLSISPVLTAGLCYVFGVAMSYALNRRWAFASNRSHAHDLPRFLAAYGVGLASTLITIAILIKWLPPEIAQLLNIGITAVIIYSMLHILQFGTRGSDNAH